MENFIHVLMSPIVRVAFFSCNVVPLAIFGIPFLLIRYFYPRGRSLLERNSVSTFISFVILGLFLYPASSDFKTVSLLNLSIIFLIMFIYWLFKRFPFSNRGEKIIINGYAVIVLCLSLFIMLNFAYYLSAHNPAGFISVFIPGFFVQYTVLCFLFLLPAVGTFWLIRDARRRRQKTKELWEKAEQVKNNKKKKR